MTTKNVIEEANSTDIAPNGLPAGCRLAELVQYDCALKGEQVVCKPIERIFKVCSGRPAVEVTRVVEWDANDKPVLPKRYRSVVSPCARGGNPVLQLRLGTSRQCRIIGRTFARQRSPSSEESEPAQTTLISAQSATRAQMPSSHGSNHAAQVNEAVRD
ncbi:hypothetical protein IE81DRAFT_346536 [Ceraceosorus guamensis]|uniref:Uncharacterized protein n=1 Tax=Ceraceosorus guamensis TaxID=1522189 RepID=A0A316W1Z5_9BASI|nr:hypothetical protein IE81DRAFT_346536 [Ceraceosorus guamensis]PWN43544.1 hypothetical protein IE81DRAFT_346536 [Ceraceosorus guamensis]